MQLNHTDRCAYAATMWVVCAFLCFGLLLDSGRDVLCGLWEIVREPDLLITDYIAVGGVGAAFVNAGLVLALSTGFLYGLSVPWRGLTAATLAMMAGFALFGKNPLNILPIVLGTALYAWVKRVPLRDHALVSLLGTSLAPIVSECWFALDIPTGLGVPLGILLGVCVGFLLPPLAAHTVSMHKGYSLYNVGLATGLLGTALVSLLKSYGYTVAAKLTWSTGNDATVGSFLGLLFVFAIFTGVRIDPDVQEKTRRLWKSTYAETPDYWTRMGPGTALVNMGVNGLLAMAYVWMAGGAFNGPTVGGILTIAGFGAQGKHARNMAPVLAGVVLGVWTNTWRISDPAILLAALFGTGLAPISNRFGWIGGMLAGWINASVVLHSGLLHGGMNLYNTGFSAGLVATVLVPLLECFWRKPRANETEIAPKDADETVTETHESNGGGTA